MTYLSSVLDGSLDENSWGPFVYEEERFSEESRYRFA